MDRRSFLALSGGAAMAASLNPTLIFADESVAQIYQQAFVIDSSGEAADFNDGFPLSEKSLKAVSESGLTAINWTVSMPTFEATVPYIAYVQQIAETYPQFLLVRKQLDLTIAKKENKLGLIMAFQHPQPFDSDLDRITTFRRLGVRIMQLTYNRRGLLGDGSLEPDNAGLSKLGHEAIALMNSQGVGVDLSHCGHKTTAEGIAASTKPPLITHTGCNAIHEHPRNKYDSELKALADKGGVVGIYLMPYLGGAPNQPSKELVMQHIDHALKVCGEDHVGIGTDGGIEKVEMTPEQEKAFKDDVAHRKAAGVSAPEEDRYPYVPDFNGPRKFELIATELEKRGYMGAAIEKVLGGNWYRVFGEIWV
jgi:membrane dipeptidase